MSVNVLNQTASFFIHGGRINWIFGQLASVARLFAQFHAGTRKLLQDFCPPLLEKPIKFILIFTPLQNVSYCIVTQCRGFVNIYCRS